MTANAEYGAEWRGTCDDLDALDAILKRANARHPVTGRFLAHDCEIDCLEHCAGLCGEVSPNDGNGA